MNKFTVITIVKNRKANLLNLLKGVEKGILKPDELIVVSMDDVLELPSTYTYSFPVRIVKLKTEHTEMLPIAKARNLGAASSKFDYLHFLDVDCIPAPNYLETMQSRLEEFGGLMMGIPRYMTRKMTANFDESFLLENSILHPARPVIYSDIEKTQIYSLFWSLCFSIHKNDFEKIGKFHENYLGYGAEDTDFAFEAEKSGVEFYFVNAFAFHQQHAVSTPPYHNMKSIIRNANIFYKRWGVWAMDNWLKMFADKKLVNWENGQSNPIEIIAEPTSKMIEEARLENAPFA